MILLGFLIPVAPFIRTVRLVLVFKLESGGSDGSLVVVSGGSGGGGSGDWWTMVVVGEKTEIPLTFIVKRQSYPWPGLDRLLKDTTGTQCDLCFPVGLNYFRHTTLGTQKPINT